MFYRVVAILSFLMILTSPLQVQAKEAGYSHKISHIPPYKISRYIKSTSGQKRAVVIYASWCPSCVEKMPDIIDLEHTKAGSIIAISVDEDMMRFVRYIKKIDEIPFRIIINKSSEWKLAKSLKQFGIRPWDSIPQIILIGADNKVVRQGNYSVDHIAEFLFSDKE